MLRLFYLLKPLLPRWLQIRLRRLRAARIRRRLGDRVVDLPPDPAPFAWPEGVRAAALVTHDVELDAGQRRIPALRRLEDRHGVRSCWNFVVERYPVDEALVADLARDGHEIGVHGVKHDGRLFSSERVFRARLAVMEDAARRWGAVGFRSPALLHDRALMTDLPFLWDSSLPAWDPFQPQPGGCGVYHPFPLENGCVELPVTLWQDFTLFEELGVDPLPVWRRQIAAIVAAGGLVNVIVHPDYLTDDARLAAYDALLAHLRELDGVWLATPRQVADWTRRSG